MPSIIDANVVSIFADQPAARAALDQLALQGVPRTRMTLHETTPTSRNAGSLEVDEFVSGGFVSNMSALLDGLFERPPAEGNAATYAGVVRSEGTLVSMHAEGSDEAKRYEALLRRAGALRVSILPEDGTVSSGRLDGH